MSIRVLVNGAYGKMGQLAVQAIETDVRFELVGKTGRKDDLLNAIDSLRAEVVVDLTEAAVVYNNVKMIIDKNVHPVIGTSGLTKAQIIELKKIASDKQLGGIIVPNFSIAAVLMMECAQKIAQHFADVSIVEAHHPHKKDAPSGTAIRTAELIAKNKTFSSREAVKENIANALGANYNGIPIHSLRLPGIIAKQSVIFGGMGETLTIVHETTNRESFMPGLLLACQKVVSLDGLFVGLESVL